MNSFLSVRHLCACFSGISVGKYLSSIADLALPRACVVCGQFLDSEQETICGHCLSDLPLCRLEKLSHNPMADRLNALLEDGPYVFACALFYYRCDYMRITPALKYGRNFAAGKFFSRMLGRRLAESELFRDVDCIIPLPLHWRRKWKRGYNQSEIIAREIASSMIGMRDSNCESSRISVQPRALKRIRFTASQTSLQGEDKKRNVLGAFAADTKKGLYGKHILLVDDVFTTGNTLAQCIMALQKAVPDGTRISVATLAFLYD